MTLHENRNKEFCFLFTPAPITFSPYSSNKVSNQRLHWSPRNLLVQESENEALDWRSYYGLWFRSVFSKSYLQKDGSFFA